MKRKNLIARKKARKKELLFKDPKILNFYTKFKSIIFKNIKDKFLLNFVGVVFAWGAGQI